MRFGRVIAATALCLMFVAPGWCRAPRRFMEAEAEGAALHYVGNVPIAILSGTPDEIGRQHAALMSEQARVVLTVPRRFAAEFGVEFLWPVMTAAGSMLMQNAPRSHSAELAALAEAGKLDAGELAVGNTLLELRRVGCSALIVDAERSAEDGPLFGRNFDFPALGVLDQYSVVLIVRPNNRRAFASVTFPGAIGVFSGMNDAGLAVATLDVYRSADGSLKFDAAGVPLAMVFRRILEECATVAEAEALLQSVKATTWMNLAVCDPESSAVFEITPKSTARRDSTEGLLACTNHFRTSEKAVDSNCWRYPRLCSISPSARLTIDDVQDRLHSANQGELTLQTMVFQPRQLTLHLALGSPPTSDDALQRIDLAPLFAPVPVVAR